MRPRNEQGGQLVVLGSDTINIRLKDYPHRVECYFKHKNSPPPCNPRHHHKHDRLHWDIHRSHRGHHCTFSLRIKWHVHEIREIVWLVYY